MRLKLNLAFVLLSIILFASLSSALFVKSADSPTIAPGAEGRLTITIENTQNDDVENLVVSLDFTNLPLSPVGSSADVIDKIKEDDEEDVSFLIRADSTAQVGDYKLPYKLGYGNGSIIQQGTVGVRINAAPQLTVTSNIDSPVIGEKTKLTIKIVNKGLGEARFVSIKLTPNGYTLFSEDSQYIGSVDSDDFETATFDVQFNSKNPSLIGIVEYRDIDNKLMTIPINTQLQVYSLEQAQELGIVKKSNALLYTLIVVVLIVLWIIYRAIRKRQRLKRSMMQDTRK